MPKLKLESDKIPKERVTVMLTSSTSDDLDSYILSLPPVKRFDGKEKKNIKSLVVEAILKTFLKKAKK